LSKETIARFNVSSLSEVTIVRKFRIASSLSKAFKTVLGAVLVDFVKYEVMANRLKAKQSNVPNFI